MELQRLQAVGKAAGVNRGGGDEPFEGIWGQAGAVEVVLRSRQGGTMLKRPQNRSGRHTCPRQQRAARALAGFPLPRSNRTQNSASA